MTQFILYTKEKKLPMELNTNVRFYYCKHCGKICVLVNETGTPTICCGEVMEELKPNQVDFVEEKHIPKITRHGQEVIITIGSKLHPMHSDHYIQWIMIQTNKGFHKRNLNPVDDPIARFTLQDDERLINVFDYCNLHKLWRAENIS